MPIVFNCDFKFLAFSGISTYLANWTKLSSNGWAVDLITVADPGFRRGPRQPLRN